MFNYCKKNLFARIIISIIVVTALIFSFSRVLSVKAQEQIKIYPTVYSGNWENPQATLMQDLGRDASLENFNSNNSASPFIVLEKSNQQSDLKLTQFFDKLFGLFRPFSAEA
jgi:hypothetical protein